MNHSKAMLSSRYTGRTRAVRGSACERASPSRKVGITEHDCPHRATVLRPGCHVPRIRFAFGLRVSSSSLSSYSSSSRSYQLGPTARHSIRQPLSRPWHVPSQRSRRYRSWVLFGCLRFVCFSGSTREMEGKFSYAKFSVKADDLALNENFASRFCKVFTL